MFKRCTKRKDIKVCNTIYQKCTCKRCTTADRAFVITSPCSYVAALHIYASPVACARYRINTFECLQNDATTISRFHRYCAIIKAIS